MTDQVADVRSVRAQGTSRPIRRPWLHVLLVGLVLWVAATAVTVVTSNTTLLPTVILLGSFLVPVVFVVWAYGRRSELLDEHTFFRCFVTGGVLGVLGASLLESYLLKPGVFQYVGVGFIEEFVKLAALAWCARGLRAHTARDGALLGATVGFSFAALESAGYAFNALFTEQGGLSLGTLIQTELLRGLLTPFGHGLWTAIGGAVLFAASPRGRLRITLPAVLAYVAVSVLHGLWDGMNGVAILLTVLVTGDSWQITSLEQGEVPQITQAQVEYYTIFDYAGLALVTLLGFLLLRLVLRHRRSRAADQEPGGRPGTDSGANPGAASLNG
jgi:RsiW-degrading membrane proteinase PrsW (M82 family)